MEIALKKAENSDIPEIVWLQRKTFLPLYEIYRDEGNPALEGEGQIRARMEMQGSWYYLIMADGLAAGAVRVRKIDHGYRISPIFILPEYQNAGAGKCVLQLLETLLPDARRWELDTIEQDARNCHFYEKCGYQKTGKEHQVNGRMTLISYEKKCI